MLAVASSAAARVITDSAGRKIPVPEKIERVFAAGPPASILLYMLAPERMTGWPNPPTAEERPFIAAPYRDLPALGHLTGRGGTANLEVVLKVKPDLILDFGSVRDTYVSLADNVQEQTKIPYVLVDGHFEATPAAGMVGSINTEIIERAGGRNVAEAPGMKGPVRTSMEQLIVADPEIIITWDRSFFERVLNDPLWAEIRAVRDKRVYLAPTAPFGWIDRPPSLNRVMGLKWLAGLLYPDKFPENIRETARAFYRLFYHIDLTEPELDTLIAWSEGQAPSWPQPARRVSRPSFLRNTFSHRGPL